MKNVLEIPPVPKEWEALPSRKFEERHNDRQNQKRDSRSSVQSTLGGNLTLGRSSGAVRFFSE